MSFFSSGYFPRFVARTKKELQPKITQIIGQSSPQHEHWKLLNQGKSLILFADWERFSALVWGSTSAAGTEWWQFTPSEALALTGLCQSLHLSKSNLKSETAVLRKQLHLYFVWQPGYAVSATTPGRSQFWKYFCSSPVWNIKFYNALLFSFCTIVQIVILSRVFWKVQDVASIQRMIYMF